MFTKGFSDRLQTQSLALLVGVALAPLPLGSNRPWAWLTLGAVFGGLILWRAVRGGAFPPLPLPLKTAAALWLGVVAWAVIQALPGLPAALHHPLWQDAGWSAEGRIGLTPAESLSGALRLLTYGLAFLLAWEAGTTPTTGRALVRGLAGAAALYAAYGLLAHLSGSNTVLWWEKLAYREVLTATFINRNAAASFFGLGLLCAVACLSWNRRSLLGLSAGGLCLLALLLTHSRAGVVATGLASALLLALLWRGERLGRRTVAALALALGTGAAGIGSGVGERLWSTDLAHLDRPAIHAATLAASLERPWSGHGLGSFDTAFPSHRPADLTQHWDKAHSSYLENAFELGWPAALALYAALTLVLAPLLLRRPCTASALGASALVLAALHATVDFTFQMPANALWLAVLAGLAAGSLKEDRRRTGGAGRSRPRGRQPEARPHEAASNPAPAPQTGPIPPD